MAELIIIALEYADPVSDSSPVFITELRKIPALIGDNEEALILSFKTNRKYGTDMAQ